MKKSLAYLLTVFIYSTSLWAQSEVDESAVHVSDTLSELNLSSNQEYFPSFTQTELQHRSVAALNQIPYHTDEEIYAKLLAIPSSIPLTYSPEIAQIVRNYVYNKRDYLTRMLTASQIYFPIFEEVFLNKGIPSELKYLSIVESALNPCARSRCGATGLWQFMHRTAKDEGMCINTHVDERRDVYRSTEFAANYLKKLYYSHNDWFLALAAYNSGSGNVNKARRNSFGYDFWSIKHKLPRETQSYVPTFIAVIYCMFYANEYKISPGIPLFDFTNTVREKIYTSQSLKYIAELTGSFEEELMQYNPALKKGIIPETIVGYDLVIPKQYAMALNNSRDLLHLDPYLFATPEQMVPEPDNVVIAATPNPTLEAIPYDAVDNNKTPVLQAVNSQEKVESPAAKSNQKYKIVKVVEYTEKKLTHHVKKGESLTEIASKYSVSIEDIKKWNDLDQSLLDAGDAIVIYKNEKTITPQYVINDEVASIAPAKVTPSNTGVGEKQLIHKVKKGETLMQLTRMYGVTLSQLKKWNFLEDLSLNIGQEIFIYTNQQESVADGLGEIPLPLIKNYSYYEVSKGDTLQIASLKLKVSLELLKSLNNKDVDEPLKEGEKIKVPAL